MGVRSCADLNCSNATHAGVTSSWSRKRRSNLSSKQRPERVITYLVRPFHDCAQRRAQRAPKKSVKDSRAIMAEFVFEPPLRFKRGVAGRNRHPKC